MISKYFYPLPTEKIAAYPAEERSNSKLLVYTQGQLTDSAFNNICSFLPDHSLLIHNTSKVMKARLFLQRETGGIMEVFCLKLETVHKGDATVECLIRNVRKLRENEILFVKQEHKSTQVMLKAVFKGRKGENSIVEFNWNPEEYDFYKILDIFGEAPLPPYIKRKAEETDAQRYQTIYAKENGSVAAPTAGLHFTKHIEEQLKAKQIETAGVVLHVGLGTFQPMKSDTLKEHIMHRESFSISTKTLNLLLSKADKTNICVGTTSLRTIESLYIAAHFADENTDMEHINIGQWDYLKINKFMTRQEAWSILISLAKKQKLDFVSGSTALMITPDYSCKTSDLLITNFHQPQSTLLLIVASFIGEQWRELYEHALNSGYRFLSYGDACLFENHT